MEFQKQISLLIKIFAIALFPQINHEDPGDRVDTENDGVEDGDAIHL